MSYFIDNIKTYANVNKKGRALQIYVQQFDRHLIANECSLDALKCDIEHQIKIMNERFQDETGIIQQKITCTDNLCMRPLQASLLCARMYVWCIFGVERNRRGHL